MVMNLDPTRTQSGMVDVPLERFGLADGQPYQVNELLIGEQYTWTGRQNYVELNPTKVPGHILELRQG